MSRTASGANRDLNKFGVGVISYQDGLCIRGAGSLERPSCECVVTKCIVLSCPKLSGLGIEALALGWSTAGVDALSRRTGPPSDVTGRRE